MYITKSAYRALILMLLVLGAPLPDREGKVALDGPVGQILNEAPDRVTLVIRSNHASVDVSSSAPHAK